MNQAIIDGVLDDTKHVLGVDHFFKEFDLDILMHVNSAFFLLHDQGVGESVPAVEADTKWADIVPEIDLIPIVKSYVFVVVRLAFDRPETSYGIQALERMRDEWGWRLEMRWREKNA